MTAPKTSFLTTAPLFLLAALAPVLGFATDSGINELTFCNFGPKVKVLMPKNAESASDKKACRASAKIQGVMWECNTPEKVEQKIESFRSTLIRNAQDECHKFCERQSDDCGGKFQIPIYCGLQTDQEDARVMGKRLGCRKDCSGSSFVYCSLYNIGFQTDDPVIMAKQTPNCRCYRKSSSAD